MQKRAGTHKRDIRKLILFECAEAVFEMKDLDVVKLARLKRPESEAPKLVGVQSPDRPFRGVGTVKSNERAVYGLSVGIGDCPC